jgi:hypothetical protein
MMKADISVEINKVATLLLYSLGSLASSAFFSVRCFFLASFDAEEDDVEEVEAENPGA